ncbi:MAG: UvrD-helicase domain-containing protein [Moheibacter sp.]
MLQPNEFKIYNASAGAGKTYTLVREYLSILLSSPNPNKFESLLAITFTNKAANEMKQRILEKLAAFASDDYLALKDLETFSKDLNLPPEQIHQRSKKILSKILHNYSRFSVSTIDKFNLRLMKSFAQDLGLSVNFNVEMDLEKLLEESVNQLFSKIGEDELLTSVLIEIALDNLQENRSWDITRELIKTSKSIYDDKHLLHLALLQKYSLDEFNTIRKTVYQKVTSKKNRLRQIAQEVFNCLENQKLSVNDFSYGNSGFIGFFLKLQKEIFEFPGSRHLAFKENTNPEKWCSGKASSVAKNAIEQIAPKLISFSDEALEELRDLPLWTGIQKTIAALSVLNEVEKSVETIKEDNNILLISEFNKRISSSLQQQPSGFIYERIGNRFQHYFIDEFQDTSELQWLNLQPLVENAQAGSDTLMLVGDAKQSIYRWRGGNPEQMIKLIGDKDIQGITVENLPKNWRSYNNIILFNNRFYTETGAKLVSEDYQKLYLEGNIQEYNDKTGGYVQLNFIEKNDGTEAYQDETLIQIRENIHSAVNQGFEYSEITVLHRTNAHGRLIAEFLSRENIPVISAESLLVTNSGEVQLIELFFKTLANEEDLVSKASFLTKLHGLGKIKPEDLTEEIQAVLNQDLIGLKNHLFAYGIDLNFIFEPSISLYDFTEKTIRQFGLGKKGSAYIQYFMDFILEYSTKNEYNLHRFLEYWEEKKGKLSISMPEGINAVNLMTIHKSKGLEFPVVILPFADWGDRMMPPKFWIPTQNEELPFEKFLVEGFGDLEKVSPEIKKIIESERNEFELDNLNMLYVATTRAIEQLYIITQRLKKDSKTKSVSLYFNQFVDSSENEVVLEGEKMRYSEPKKTIKQTETIPFVSEKWNDKISISKESSKKWQKGKAIVYGELIHDFMRFIHTRKDIEPTLRNIIHSGLIGANEAEILRERILEILSHPELKIYFSTDYQSINERDFINETGGIYRPDRIAFQGKTAAVIDYKTGQMEEKHIAQIKAYAENLKKNGFEIKEKLLVYIGEEIEVKKVE